MIFTGKNLVKVRDAVKRAINDVHMEIGMCPDHIKYSDEIDALEEEQAEFEKLLVRVEKAITKEQP